MEGCWLDNAPIIVTKVFPADELVWVTIQVDDPDRSANWKQDIRSDAAYEGAQYCGTTDSVDDDAVSVVVPKADLRRWERASASNGADVMIGETPGEGSFALPKLTDHEYDV